MELTAEVGTELKKPYHFTIHTTHFLVCTIPEGQKRILTTALTGKQQKRITLSILTRLRGNTPSQQTHNIPNGAHC